VAHDQLLVVPKAVENAADARFEVLPTRPEQLLPDLDEGRGTAAELASAQEPIKGMTSE
jgi:hypothetical protein